MDTKNVMQISKSILIAVPIEELWEITAINFQNVDAWISGVNHSEGTGSGMNAERSCLPSYKGFSQTAERIIDFSPNKYRFTYEIIKGLPGFVEFAKNEWIHREVSGGTEITMEVTMKVKGFMGWLMGGIMKRKMGNILVDALEELKTYAETGQLHERKKAALEKYQMGLA